jgi:DNA-binding IclR family transcriptional regulator
VGRARRPRCCCATPATRAGPRRAQLALRRGHVKRLREWIDEAATQGYAVSHGERDEGLSAVAAPIVGRSGTVVAALGLSGPTLRFTESRIAEFAADLKRVARHISDRGFDHPLGIVH